MSDDAKTIVERLRLVAAEKLTRMDRAACYETEAADVIESLQAERDRYAALIDELIAWDEARTTTKFYDIIARAKALRQPAASESVDYDRLPS